MLVRAPRIRSHGTTLLEVVAALALIAGALVFLAGLLGLAGRQIAAGRHRTLALAAARDAAEAVGAWSPRRTLAVLECDPELPVCSAPSIPGQALGLRSDVSGVLPHCRVEIRIEALDASTLASATTLRVSLLVEWRDVRRRRSVRVLLVKT